MGNCNRLDYARLGKGPVSARIVKNEVSPERALIIQRELTADHGDEHFVADIQAFAMILSDAWV